MATQRARLPRSVLLTAVVATVVALGAFGVVYVLRPKPEVLGGSAAEPAATATAAVPACGAGPCRQLAAVTVAGQPVVLLADAEGRGGRVQVGPAPGTLLDLGISQLETRLDPDSLRCVDGKSPACLVRGTGDRGMYGELLVADGGVWTDDGKPYFSDAGVVALNDVNTDGRPDVIVVRHLCPDSASGEPACQVAPVLAEVYDLSGKTLGCTRKVASPSQLRGWPDLRLQRSDLRACP